jgi:dTDP-4-amino-4,6-dideoxygalactose transaminase
MKYIGKEELDALEKVIESEQLWRGEKGNFVVKFEEAVAKHFNRKYAYAVNSGTSANEAAVAGLGLEPGDEVICPAATPIFPALSVFAAGCIPVFSDVDPRTLIIAPEEIEERLSDRTRAIYVVHFWGQPAPMDEIMEIAGKHNLKVIEDCAEAYDCYYKKRKVGTYGDVAIFSLQQSKHITSGEGGFLVTDNTEIYKRAVLYSNCGMAWFLYGLEAPKPEFVAGFPTRGHLSFGHNHRMSELQGAVAFVQLQKLRRFNMKRKKLVKALKQELKDCPGILLIPVYPQTEPNYWVYPVQIDPEKTSLTAFEVYERCLKEEGIRLSYFNDTVDYLEPVFRKAQRERKTPFGYPLPEYVRYEPGLCPKAEEAAKRTIMFWVHHRREEEELRREARALKNTMMRNVK